MKIIKVVAGILPVGEGERLFLSAAQIAPRQHKLRDVGDDKDFAFCTAAGVLQFKTGEVLGVESVAKPHAELVEEVSAGGHVDALAAQAPAEVAPEKPTRSRR